MAEEEFKTAYGDVSEETQKKRGKRLERSILHSLRELQKRFDEIVLFDVEERSIGGLEQKYKIIMDKNGIRRSTESRKETGATIAIGGFQTISEYIKRSSRYHQGRQTNGAYDQITIAERIDEIYRGIKRPMKISVYWD